MKFTSDILRAIIQMGDEGKSFKKIAREYGMTSSELRAECLINEKLKAAIDEADFNYKMTKKDELESNPTPDIKRMMYENILKEAHNSDNIIIIEDV